MKLYKSYGELAHEKQPVYSAGCHGEIYDTIEVELPEGWTTAETVAGEALIISPDGETWLGDDIITNWGDEPALEWVDAIGSHRKMLRVVEH